MKIVKEKAADSNFLLLHEGQAMIAAGPNSISTTREDGNFINGPLSISSTIDSIRVGGMFKFNPALMTGIPSTIITPIPVLTLDMPVKNVGVFGSIAAIAASLF